MIGRLERSTEGVLSLMVLLGFVPICGALQCDALTYIRRTPQIPVYTSSVGTSTVDEGVNRVEVSHMASCIGRAFHSGFHTSGPLIHDREKDHLRLFDISALAEDPLRFEEGYLPSSDQQ